MITDRQVGLLRQKRMEGKTQETAAAKAGISVRSARKWQSGPLPSQAKPEHRWRTRPDPFDGVWEDEIGPLLRNDPTGKLKAHCLKSNVTELRSHKAPGGSSHETRDTLDTVVGKTRRNASENPIWASILPASSTLLIPSVVRQRVIM